MDCDDMKLYKAMVWKPAEVELGRRTSVLAETLMEAKAKLEEQYGAGTVFNLHNEDDAAVPR
jgi:hypothetical protein